MAILAHVHKISLITADGGDNYREYYRLNKTVGEIFHIYMGLNAMGINPGIHTQKSHTGNVAANNANNVEQGGEQGKTDYRSGNPG